MCFVPFFGRGGPHEAIVEERKNVVSESRGGPFPDFGWYGIRARGSSVLIFLKIKSSSSRVKGLRSIGGGCWTRGVRGMCVTLGGGGGWSIVWTGNDRLIVRLFALGGGDSRWGL